MRYDFSNLCQLSLEIVPAIAWDIVPGKKCCSWVLFFFLMLWTYNWVLGVFSDIYYISQRQQIKPQLFTWLHTTRGKWEKMFKQYHTVGTDWYTYVTESEECGTDVSHGVIGEGDEGQVGGEGVPPGGKSGLSHPVPEDSYPVPLPPKTQRERQSNTDDKVSLSVGDTFVMLSPHQ